MRFEDGSRVPMGSSWVRVAVPTAAGTLVWGVGWFVAWLVLAAPTASSLGRRGFHDRMAGTIVVARASAQSCRKRRSACEAPVTASGLAAAGLGARVQAGMTDLVAGAPFAVVGWWAVYVAAQGYDARRGTGGWTLGDLTRASVGQWAPKIAVLAALAALWTLVPLARVGATAGMRLAGIKVAHWRGSGSAGLGRALLHWSASVMPLALGMAVLLWPWLSGADRGIEVLLAALLLSGWVLLHASVLWDPQRRGWHDKLAGVIVIANHPDFGDSATPHKGS